MIETVSLQADILARRKGEAESFRQSLTHRKTLCVNIISSPGAGKTSLLEATARYWGSQRRMAVLVGDIATDRDAQRLAPLVPVRQLTTGGACHLELPLIRDGFELLSSDELDFLFIENIGNLVCPASHDLGEHLRVVVLSVTEGDDKPGKYPKAFRTSQAAIASKVDLLPHVPFSVKLFTEDARLIQPGLEVLSVSSITQEGIKEWCCFLDEQRKRVLSISLEQ